MTQRTALLPEVEFDRPSETVGHNTVEAMRTGVFSAITGMVYTLTERYAEVAGSFPLVVVTGGDGPLLFKDDPRVDRLVPDLTLLGIALTWRTARQQQDDA
jgi:type III pantothenate kinase